MDSQSMHECLQRTASSDGLLRIHVAGYTIV